LIAFVNAQGIELEFNESIGDGHELWRKDRAAAGTIEGRRVLDPCA
jgi:hypothetical protein